ncbi:hypothetical protein KSK55_02670 [Methanospirillum purgamenti]|jgi:RPA family protein|uniref:Uncharacterized protein n=1 Tax=Methanospirillum hungatei TaxID=2203 RepID=A0A8F5VLM5_METHU|nr:hypothetical protein [Methanospirillum hungatei]QXO95327.1 hypothetical protein KSK55_02670 [Methanospirillum hungatei]
MTQSAGPDQCIYQSAGPTTSVYVTEPVNHHIREESAFSLPLYSPVLLYELNQTDYIIRTSGKEYSLITPTGLHLQKVWLTGALTSYEIMRHEGILRIADPTGAMSFSLKPQALDPSLEPSDLVPPLFLSITAHAEKGNQGEEKIRWVIESCTIASRQDRDGWILETTHQLLNRLHTLNTFIKTGEGHNSLNNARKHYNIQIKNLKNLAEQSGKALDVVKGPGPVINPAELILSIITEYSGPKGIQIEDIFKYAKRAAFSEEIVKTTIKQLIEEDEVYQPAAGFIKLL